MDSTLSDSTLAAERSALRKATRRLIPFLFILYIVAYLDRVNVSFAAIHMKEALNFSDSVYGFGAGVFFIGYFLFEIPSNLILAKVGARLWIARIMLVWGILAVGMAFVWDKTSFYSLRFLLGLGEAGFFPGMILYLTYWFPAAERARTVSLFMTATATSNAIGSPISGALLGLHGWHGLDGWQWIFIIEGIPAILFAVVVFFYMTDRPELAHWLTAEEREALTSRINRESETRAKRGHPSLRALLDPKVALLSSIYFCTVTGGYGVQMWLPQIVKNFKLQDDMQIALVSGIPYLFAVVAMVLNGLHSDRTGERKFHVAIPAFTAATGLALTAVLGSIGAPPVLQLITLSMTTMGLSSYLGPFWALPTAFLTGVGAAGGIALINSVGNLGGFVGPYAIGYIKEHYGGFLPALLTVAAIVSCGGFLVLTLKHDRSLEHG